jgi:hypothetical protein
VSSGHSSSYRRVTRFRTMRKITPSGMSKTALVACCPCSSGAESPGVSSRAYGGYRRVAGGS